MTKLSVYQWSAKGRRRVEQAAPFALDDLFLVNEKKEIIAQASKDLEVLMIGHRHCLSPRVDSLHKRSKVEVKDFKYDRDVFVDAFDQNPNMKAADAVLTKALQG